MGLWYNKTGDKMIKAYPGKWIVAVSGQNDSMALLHMCIEQKMDVHACIIHYHKRLEADLEVEYIVQYAQKHHISCDVIHAPEFKNNFQQAARDFRYAEFAKLVKKYKAEGVLVGHHYDDQIETILWQQQRNHRVAFHGLQEETIIQGVRVVRPLLKFHKEELLAYNIKHHVHFFEDKSNEDLSYTRNKIRNQISGMSLAKKEELIRAANEKNRLLVKQRTSLQPLLSPTLNISSLINLVEEDQLELLWMYFTMMEYPFSISKRNLKDIMNQIQINPIGQIPLKNKYVLSFAQGILELKTHQNCEYEYTLETLKNISTEHFTIKLESDTLDGVYVKDEDWPITIRNFRNGDKIQLEFGHKKLTTWFNQQKIPWIERQCWPVVTNKNNEIIYVMGWLCDINHSTNNPNLFMLK